ncbi:MAG: ATP-binding protein [Rhodobacteraceae bacterium]|nr:ATP-binding protein [Paracoccaceae bacterium]
MHELIWSCLPIAALVVDSRNRVINVNPAAESLFNCSARSLTGRPVSELSPNGKMLTSNLRQVRERQSPVLLDNFMITAQGRGGLLSNLQIAPIPDGFDKLLICIRSREIEGRISRGALAKSAALSAVGLADMLSHEIRNPLSGIVGAAQLLAMKLQGEDLELTSLIVDEAYRIRRLVEQVDQLGTAEAGECNALNVHDLLNQACRTARVGFAAGVQIDTEYDPSLPEIYADGDKLLRAFLNLLQNASEALVSQGSGIRVRTFYDGSLRVRNAAGREQALPVHVEIIDDGPGIDPELTENAFEPFVSGRLNGTGLGLAMVSAILSELGGWISFESQPGNTVFRVSLPVAADVNSVN